jgi:8-oxo-dGTP diphosphatase
LPIGGHKFKIKKIMVKVTAAVIEENGKYLIAKRRAGERFEGLWEFPGGKLEPGEAPEECLRRELREELGIETRVDGLALASRYESPLLSIELLAYRVTYLSGEFRFSDHDEIRWVAASELGEFNFTEPDLPIVRLVVEERLRSKPK